MAAPRKQLPGLEEKASFPLERARGRLALPKDHGEKASELSRGAAELAASHGSPLVVIASHGHLASSLRTARLIGMEPRVLAPAGQPGLPTRLTLSLPMRGTLGPSARASCVAYLAAFAGGAGGAGGAGSAAGGSRSASGKVAEAIARTTSHLGVKFTFELLAQELSRKPAAVEAPGLEDALMRLHEAELQASIFTTPVPWSRVLAPSPRGRPAAVWLDLSSLTAEAAARVGGLALASLAATVPEWSPTLSGHPPVLVAQGVTGPVGTFALSRLLGATPPTPLCGLLVERAGEAGEGVALPGVASAMLSPAGLSFEGVDTPLPLPDVGGEATPLSAEECDALIPLTLRERMLGPPGDDEGDVEAGAAENASAKSPRGRASSEALQQASQDLDKIARTGVRPGKRRAGRRRVDYEAGDFDLG